MKIFFYIFLLVFGCGLSFANDKNVENNNQKTDIASDDFKYENSVFFTDKKINIIDRVYKIYEKNMKYKDKEVITDIQIENDIDESRSLMALDVITLNSVLFLNPNDWVVWINNKKITSLENKLNKYEFKIIETDGKQVSFYWVISRTRFDIINKKNLIQENNYEVNKNNKIELKIKLYVNQSYIPAYNVVINSKDEEEYFKKLIENNKLTKNEENNNMNDENDIIFKENEKDDDDLEKLLTMIENSL